MIVNQYGSDFRESIEARYKKDIVDVLLDFQRRGLSYDDAGQEVGYHALTIRRWCYRYAIKLTPKYGSSFQHAIVKKPREKTFFELFSEKKMNLSNCLSRSWVTT